MKSAKQQIHTNIKKTKISYRKQSFPEIKISFRSFSDSSSPWNKHHKRPTSERQSRSKPRVRKSIEDFLVIDIEDNIKCPPSSKIDSNFQFLCWLFIRKLDVNVEWTRSISFVSFNFDLTLKRKVLCSWNVERLLMGDIGVEALVMAVFDDV